MRPATVLSAGIFFSGFDTDCAITNASKKAIAPPIKTMRIKYFLTTDIFN